MGLWKGIKNVLYKSDLFDSGSLLRVKGEPEYKTLLGGFLSIAMMIVLIAAFYNKIIATLDKLIINSASSTTNANDPLPYNISLGDGSFMFGVEVWHHDLNHGSRLFDVVLTNVFYSYGEPLDTSIQYSLEPCTREHWTGFPQIQASFDSLSMSYWKCLPKNALFEIKGKYSSEDSKTLNVAIKKCTNSSADPRPCAPEAEINDYFAENGINFFTIYFINPLINPDKQDYLTYYLEDTNYIMFSQNFGAEGLLYVQEYSVETDESILPTSAYSTKTGGIVPEFADKNSYSAIIDTYAVFIFYKSPTSLTITRSFQKLDNVFSYIGGLFGTILIFFFLLSAYNTNKFEVNLAGYLYRAEEKEEKIEKDYNFGYFIGQGVYSFLRLLNLRPKWETVSRYHKIREEMLKQLDVLYLIKRINFLEQALTFLFSEQQLKGIHLASQLTMADAVKIRRSYRLKARLKEELCSIKAQNCQKVEPNAREHSDKNNSSELIDFKIGRPSSIYPGERHAGSPQLHFDSDNYSSEDASSSEEEEEESLLSEISHLRRERKDSVSKKIWRNIDVRLRKMIESSPNVPNFRVLVSEPHDEERSSGSMRKPMNIEMNPLFLDPPELTESLPEANHELAKVMFSKLQPVKISNEPPLDGNQSEQNEQIQIKP